MGEDIVHPVGRTVERKNLERPSNRIDKPDVSDALPRSARLMS